MGDSDGLFLDVFIHHPKYPIPEDLKKKVAEIFKLRDKDIRLINSELGENNESMWIEDVKCPILNCLDVDC